MTIDEVIGQQIRAAVAEAIAPLLAAARPTARISYTIREAAEVSGANEHTIRQAITEGHLTAIQPGGKTSTYIIPADALNAWVHGVQQPIPLSRKAR
ncbi:excisionase family DNA-binding protein [Deinococcus sp. UYEF24]